MSSTTLFADPIFSRAASTHLQLIYFSTSTYHLLIFYSSATRLHSTNQDAKPSRRPLPRPQAMALRSRTFFSSPATLASSRPSRCRKFLLEAACLAHFSWGFRRISRYPYFSRRDRNRPQIQKNVCSRKKQTGEEGWETGLTTHFCALLLINRIFISAHIRYGDELI